jgi:allophanate hydrolase subunit 1
MTKVQIDFHLQRPLDDQMMKRIAEANAIYGIERIQVQPSLEDLTVEYDASRLRPSEVHAALTAAGIPAIAKNQKPASPAQLP